LLARTNKNKATAYHIGTLKAKLAKLKRELLTPAGGGGGKGEGSSRFFIVDLAFFPQSCFGYVILVLITGFDVKSTGDARVGLVGFPSVGKSTLLNKLTGTFSAVAAYEFTTLTTVPGIIRYKARRLSLLSLAVTVLPN
jgi:ribosome-interacting GTPase 1